MVTKTGFRDNSVLIKTADIVNVEANNANDVYFAVDNTTKGATAFVIASGATGDDTLLGFDNNDSIINGSKIFDGNDDGFIQFGANGLLDIDRTSRKNAGEDSIQVGGDNDQVIEIRYLGNKGGNFVYAESSTLKNLWTDFGGQKNVLEGTVGNDTLEFGMGAKTLLVDNALGLNLGSDSLNNFGKDDLIVTTKMLFDATGDMTVTFGKNLVLDVSGDLGPKASDPAMGPGGQIEGNDFALQAIKYLGAETINGVEYFFYGTTDTTASPFLV